MQLMVAIDADGHARKRAARVNPFSQLSRPDPLALPSVARAYYVVCLLGRVPGGVGCHRRHIATAEEVWEGRKSGLCGCGNYFQGFFGAVTLSPSPSRTNYYVPFAWSALRLQFLGCFLDPPSRSPPFVMDLVPSWSSPASEHPPW